MQPVKRQRPTDSAPPVDGASVTARLATMESPTFSSTCQLVPSGVSAAASMQSIINKTQTQFTTCSLEHTIRHHDLEHTAVENQVELSFWHLPCKTESAYRSEGRVSSQCGMLTEGVHDLRVLTFQLLCSERALADCVADCAQHRGVHSIFAIEEMLHLI